MIQNQGDDDRLERLYGVARALPADAREAFLDEACDGDPELRAELDSLLAEGAGAETFMEDVGRLVEPPGSDPPARLVSALAGRYAIEGVVGEGGMATVYRALDLRHQRMVALKVLRPELAAIVGSERFLAEIRTTANLQHPAILALFDSGEADGFLYYVMPYVRGESLRDRLDRERQLPIDDAVRLAIDMAVALDYAHRQGVIHRDIKPANVLLQDGKPVIADFGIALAVSAGGGGRLTETGLSLGTPHYMSPEQATGDQRLGPQTDIYGLGCVLFEMLVGEPPFTGSTPQSVLGKIITGDAPSARDERGSVPLHVDAVIRRALEKLPADRFRRAADFARALADPGFRHGLPVGEPAASTEPRRLLPKVAGPLAAFAAGLLVTVALRQDEPPPVIRYEQTFPPGEAPVSRTGRSGPSLALSDDGSTMAYIGAGPDGGQSVSIWIRERDQDTGRRIAGTNGAMMPFLSPDGRRVGFIEWTVGLKTVSLEGGPPLTLVGGGVQRNGAAWGRDGYVYYIGETFGLYRVPEGGGDGEEVASARREERVAGFAWPDVLPGGGGVLVTVNRGPGVGPDNDIGVIDLESGRLQVLVDGVLGRYLPPGYLVYVTFDGDLLAAPFDEDALRITGPAVPLMSGLQGEPGPDLALSRSGRLMYQSAPEPTLHELVWVDRSGGVAPAEPGWMFEPHSSGQRPVLSPGDRQIVLSLIPEHGPHEVWVQEIGGSRRRLPFDGGAYRATWSPDGEYIVFLSDVLDAGDVWTRRADATGVPERVVRMEGSAAQASWAPDGSWLLLRTAYPFRGDIFGFDPANDTMPRPLVATEFFEAEPTLSPDGRFLAYVSDALGSAEVLVRPYPGLDAITEISLEGGWAPLWSHDGRELFYVTANLTGESDVPNWLVAVRFDTREGFRILGRDTLFAIPPGLVVPGPYITNYDVTEDGERFLMFRCVDGADRNQSDLGCSPARGSRYHVVENFHQEVLRRAGN